MQFGTKPRLTQHRSNRADVWTAIGAFNNRKGYGNSIKKAFLAAYAEEKPRFNVTNFRMLSFMVYVLARAYFKSYNKFVSNIYFKSNASKFIVQTLVGFIPVEFRQFYTDIEKELLEECERKRRMDVPTSNPVL